MNGDLTMGENLADLGGISRRCALAEGASFYSASVQDARMNNARFRLADFARAQLGLTVWDAVEVL